MARPRKTTTVKRSLPAPRQEAATEQVTEQANPERRPKHYVRDRILKAIESGAGVTVYAEDMVKDFDVPLNTVQAAARALVEQVPQVEAVIPARAWRWSATAKASNGKRMFEELTTTKAGVVLVQDEDGNVYKLEEL